MVVIERRVADVRAGHKERSQRCQRRKRRTRDTKKKTVQSTRSSDAQQYAKAKRRHQVWTGYGRNGGDHHRDGRWRLKKVVAIRKVVVRPRRHKGRFAAGSRWNVAVPPTRKERER